MIIDGVRAKGDAIVPLHELIGRPGRTSCPPFQTNERWAARLDWMGFAIWDLAGIPSFGSSFSGDLLMTGRMLFVGAFAIFDRFRQKTPRTPEELESYKPASQC